MSSEEEDNRSGSGQGSGSDDSGSGDEESGSGGEDSGSRSSSGDEYRSGDDTESDVENDKRRGKAPSCTKPKHKHSASGSSSENQNEEEDISENEDNNNSNNEDNETVSDDSQRSASKDNRTKKKTMRKKSEVSGSFDEDEEESDVEDYVSNNNDGNESDSDASQISISKVRRKAKNKRGRKKRTVSESNDEENEDSSRDKKDTEDDDAYCEDLEERSSDYSEKPQGISPNVKNNYPKTRDSESGSEAQDSEDEEDASDGDSKGGDQDSEIEEDVFEEESNQSGSDGQQSVSKFKVREYTQQRNSKDSTASVMDTESEISLRSSLFKGYRKDRKLGRGKTSTASVSGSCVEDSEVTLQDSSSESAKNRNLTKAKLNSSKSVSPSDKENVNKEGRNRSGRDFELGAKNWMGSNQEDDLNNKLTYMQAGSVMDRLETGSESGELGKGIIHDEKSNRKDDQLCKNNKSSQKREKIKKKLSALSKLSRHGKVKKNSQKSSGGEDSVTDNISSKCDSQKTNTVEDCSQKSSVVEDSGTEVISSKCSVTTKTSTGTVSESESDSSGSSSELSDESYILQKFTSSSSEDNKSQRKRRCGKGYPPPVEKPHRALYEHTHITVHDLRGGGLFRVTDNRLQDELMRTTQLIYSCESGRMVPRLREPRNLYALAKELGPQQAARWPSEIQVQKGRVLHQYYVPPEPEPFYKMTGTEKTPMCRGEENGGKVVFEYDPKFSFFMRSRVGGSRNGCSKCAVDLESETDDTLIFESRFESGNLAKAIKVGDYDYELWLRYDLYTNKHTQWFYFRVNNMKPNIPYRFTIVNFLKPDSLYNFGMRPCLYSDKEAAQNKVGWTRAGQNIKYYRNNLRYETNKGDRSFYSLTWTMTFPHEHDTAYLAHCYPYTYSDLQDYLLELQNDPIKSRICKQRVLCRTLAGNLVYVLTITSASQNPEDMKHKKAVVLTSRVHPGESNASWMMKGFLDYLTGNSADAKLLRDTFIFKIVPMLNPDGVIVGNYRCSLAGRDLNRNYKTVLKDSYPSVWHTKSMIRKLLQERDIIVYCDLHGHSRRQNVFIYGCEQKLNTNKRLHERIFPCMLNKNAPDKFSYDSCKFKVQKSKEGTGRIVMWNMGIMNSYTMEATFCGSTLGKKKGFHFSVADYEALGYHFCDTLLDYCDPDNSKYANVLGNLENRLKMEIMARFGRDTSNPADINLSDFASDMESSDGGSDSSVSDGPPVHLQYNLARPLKKKKKLKSRKDRDRVRQVRSEEPKKPAAGTQTEEKEKQGRGGAGEGGSSRPDKVGTGHASSGKLQEKERYEEKQQKRQDYLDALTSAYLRNGIPVNKESGAATQSKPHSEQLRQLHQQSQRQRQHQQRAREEQEKKAERVHKMASKWMPDTALRLTPLMNVPTGDSAFKIWKLLSRRQAESMEMTPVVDPQTAPTSSNVDEFVRSQITHSQSISPLDRRPPSRPHILEVSAAQQRQQDSLKGESDSAHTTRSQNSTTPTDNRGKTHLRTRVPSATAVNYRSNGMAGTATQPVSLLGPGTTGEGQAGGSRRHSKAPASWERDRNQDGRKSRKGMRDGEEEDMDLTPGPRTLIDMDQGLSHRTPKVKSAQTPQDVADAMDSIRQLQNSLHRPKPTLTSATGTYIKQLIKETNDEIEDLTNEIEDEIEHKLQEVRDLQHHPGTLLRHPGASSSSTTHHHHYQGAEPGHHHPTRSSSATTSRGATIDFQPQPTARSDHTSDQPVPSQKDRTLSVAAQVAAACGNNGEGGPGRHEERKRQGSAYSSSSGREDYIQLTNTDGGGERPYPPKYP